MGWCNDCKFNKIEPGTGYYSCGKGLNHHGCVKVPCEGFEYDKPPAGCTPYYVAISKRIKELCGGIERNAAEKGKHNIIKLWAAEIQYLNEMDRMLRRVEAEKTWVEEKDGTLKEVE